MSYYININGFHISIQIIFITTWICTLIRPKYSNIHRLVDFVTVICPFNWLENLYGHASIECHCIHFEKWMKKKKKSVAGDSVAIRFTLVYCFVVQSTAVIEPLISFLLPLIHSRWRVHVYFVLLSALCTQFFFSFSFLFIHWIKLIWFPFFIILFLSFFHFIFGKIC